MATAIRKKRKKVKIEYVKKCKNCGKFVKKWYFMLKLDFTKDEVNEIKNKTYLSEMQERIFEYRLKEYSITKMAILENVSESTINREIKKIKKKIMKVL